MIRAAETLIPQAPAELDALPSSGMAGHPDGGAARLRASLRTPQVSIYRADPSGGGLVLLDRAPAERSGPALGTRLTRPTGLLAAALRTGEPQHNRNAYVEPDFVRSLPGEQRSEVAVPFGTPAGVRGVVLLEYSAPHQPGPDHEATAAEIGRETAQAMEHAATGSRGAAAVLGLCQLVAQTDDAAAATERLLEGAREVGAYRGAVLAMRHGSRRMLEVLAVAGEAACAPGALLPLEEGAAGEALRTLRPLRHSRVSGTPLFGPDHPAEPGGGALVLPVCAAGKALGVLVLTDREHDSPPPVEVVDALQALAGLAGTLESSRQVGTLRQRLSDSSMIAEVGRAMTGTLGVDEVLGLVVNAAALLANGKGVALGMLADDGAALRLASTSGVLARASGTLVPVRESVMGWAALEGEIVTTEAVSDDPRGFPHDVRQGPAVVIPLESRGRIRGSLMVTRAEGAPLPSDEDIDALRKLSAYAAIALDNAQLYHEQLELSTALKAQAVELERAYAELRDSQDRLVVSEKMAALGRLTAGIAHEINSPLGGIMNCLQLALSYVKEYRDSIADPDVTPEDHQAIAHDLTETLTMAEGSTRKVGQFVRTIKGQTRTGDEGSRQRFDPAEEIDGTLMLLQHELRNRQVTLDTAGCERGHSIVGDPGKLALVVQNLVSNAVDAYGGSEGEVQIRFNRRDDRFVLEVEDHGCGIPENIRGRIFDYLFTTKDVGQGTGLGLSIVHSIVTTSFNGEIELDTEIGRGSIFRVTFPAHADGN